MHIGGNVIGLDRVLEQQTVAGVTRGQRVEVGFRDDRSARTRHRENVHRGRDLRADRLHVLPDLVAGVGPSVTTAFGLVARTSSASSSGLSIQLTPQAMPAPTAPIITT